MDVRDETSPLPAEQIVEQLRLRIVRFLGGRDSRHWLVDSDGEQAVLRSSVDGPAGDLRYELELLRRLADLGWRVPEPIGGPQPADGRQWCLFTFRSGAPRAMENDQQEQRERGRLLARLHADTAMLLEMGQRPGWRNALEVALDPDLASGLRAYERVRPDDARVIHWHLDRTQELFTELDATSAPQTILHGDLAPWNLHYVEGRLTGVLDFEFAHLNLRVSDFAHAWRGRDDEVVRGYQDVTPLDERELQLITPAFWSWLMHGIADELQRPDLLAHPPRFDWSIRHLLRRTPLMGAAASAYRT